MSVQQLKRRRNKPAKNFGRDAEVLVTAEPSVYHGKQGRVVNGEMTMDGKYLVAFGRPTGDQFIYGDDLDPVEDAPVAEPDFSPSPFSHVPDQMVPVAIVHPDPNQPRKTFNHDSLQELADDVKAEGILQALLLRPHATLPEGHYMIVFGERRWRAAKLAGHMEIPAKVRVISDRRALQLQVIENSHREDVHPLEEGTSFRQMREYNTTEEIAHFIRRGKTYVRERMSLTNLTPAFQEIFLAGHISFANALLLCKAAANVQEQILKESTKCLKPGQDGWKLGNLVDQIRQGERNLELATFETEDVLLYPEMGACGACVHNSAVNELFGDINGRICNNAGCFAIKTERAFEANVKHNIADGVLLVSVYDYSELGRKRVAAVKEMGLPVLMDGAVKIVERSAEPTLEGYIAKNPGVNELLLEQRFGGEHQAWVKQQEDIAAAEADGRLKKAYVVAGVKAGTFQDVIVTKVAVVSSPEDKNPTSAPAQMEHTSAGGIKSLLEKVPMKGRNQEGLSDKYKAASSRREATKLFYEIVAMQFKDFGCIETPAEETALVLLLWGYMEDEGNYEELERLQKDRLQADDTVYGQTDIRLFQDVYSLKGGLRMQLIGDLARGLILSRFNRDVDYTTDATGACLRELVKEYNPKALMEIETKIVVTETAKP